MVLLDKIIEQFVKEGYVKVAATNSLKNLKWQPDIIFSKKGFKFLVLVKSNNSIPPSFLNRISNIPKGNFIPLILFAQKLKDKDEKDILSLGISIAYFIRGKLVDVKIRKKISQNVVKEDVKSKLPMINIFVSSKQDGIDNVELEERKLIRKTINLLHDTRDYPFGRPRCIEYNSFALHDLNKQIVAEMKTCHWIIILLEDSRSPTVSFEIKKALTLILHKNIFMFVKDTIACKTIWKKELTKIENLPGTTVKWLPYSNVNDLEVTLTRAIDKRMNEIYKKLKIERFA